MNGNYYIERRSDKEMNRTHLIQRLKAPYRNGDVTTPFSFGGGLVNGGLSKEALDAMRGVFSFEYMGSSEFEWGAVPAALSRIARDRKQFVAGRVEIDPQTVRTPFKCNKPTGNMSVYFLAHEREAAQVKVVIAGLAKDEFKLCLKESCGLDRALCADKYAASGWLELNNGFLFFVDRQMFSKAAVMFDIAINAATTAVEAGR